MAHGTPSFYEDNMTEIIRLIESLIRLTEALNCFLQLIDKLRHLLQVSG